jgi:hypothetical protein
VLKEGFESSRDLGFRNGDEFVVHPWESTIAPARRRIRQALSASPGECQVTARR